ncbi:MAG: PqqD family protein [Pyrinomonadaceae bacterium]
MKQNPIARKNNIVVQEMPDEVLIYDLDTNKAHCLNETSALVWKACNGSNTVEEISRLCGVQTGAKVPEELVWLAIDQFSKSNLLEEKMSLPVNGQSRRELIKKIGLATVIALPLVASLAAPNNVLAVASCPPVTNCTSNTQCTPCDCSCADATTGVCPTGQTGTCTTM